MRTSNIVFRKLRRMEGYTYDTATISGVSIKSTILLLITLVSACLSIIFLRCKKHLKTRRKEIQMSSILEMTKPILFISDSQKTDTER